MSTNKLNNLIEKYNLTNLIKVIVILIILFLLYRIFIESNSLSSSIDKNVYEGFSATLGNGSLYGNVISLLNPTNIPNYSGNTCIFRLSNTFRIDTLEFLLNTGNSATPTPTNSSFYNSGHTITISYMDGNGNVKNINAVSSVGTTVSGSPPSFVPGSNNTNNTNKLIKLTSITDEIGLPIYTSQIIFNVIGNNNTIDKIVDSTGYGYIKGFGIYGGDKNLPTLDKYTNLCNTLTLNNSFTGPTNSTPTKPNTNVYTFTQGSQTTIYSLALTIEINPLSTPIRSTDKPFIIQITYQNNIYTQNIFTINTPYIVRSDYNSIRDGSTYAYIFLTEPIIASTITFTVLSVPITGNVNAFTPLSIKSITALHNIPTASDISDYKQTINLLQSSQDTSDNTNICPSINELVNTQTKTQQICDNMEYQDKVKSEKLRLERNKQYLLKLKDQQDQIDQLNSAIQTLEDKRQARAQSSDQLRVLQYQKQKGDASSIRDLANQRLQSQDNNQLYMDVNVITN
jgi:hypothetical protein